MKTQSFISIFIATSFLLMGCETLMTRRDVRDVEQKRQIQDQVVTQQQRTNADINNRLSDVDSDLRAMNGRIEVLENKVGQQSQDRDKNKNSFEQQQEEQNKKIQILQETVIKLQDQLNTLSAEMGNAKSNQNENVSSDKANKKDYLELAEERFKEKDWKRAILNYQKFRDANPHHKKFAEATLRIGASFHELGMKDEAKSFYDEVIAKFPNSLEAKKAKIRLKTLKK